MSQVHAFRPARGNLLALLLAAALIPARTWAVDAVAGRSLYNNSVGPTGSTCANSNCHGTNPASGANKIRNGANTPSAIQRGITNDSGGMKAYSGKFTAADLANIAAYIGITAAVSPASLAFPSTAVGSSSAQTLTVTSQGATALKVNSFTTTGADFAVGAGGTCTAGGSVAGFSPSTGKYSSCTIVVTFGPQAGGARTGTLAISTSDPALPSIAIALSGSGVSGPQPSASIAPASLSFGATTVGTQATAQSVTLGNSGPAALNISSIALNSTDFVLAGGTCATATPVAASTGSCTVLVNFAPQAAGARSGTLSIAHNAPNSPSTVTLSGSATASSPVAQLSSTTLSFSQPVGTTSAAQTVTLSNAGTAPLALSSVGLAGANAADFAIATGTTCTGGATLAAGTACGVKLTFTPAASGSRVATLSISHNDSAHSPSTVALAGTGTTAAAGQVSVNKTALSFPAQPQGSTSAAQGLAVSNSGSAPMTLSSITLAGANAGDYAIAASGTTCNTSSTMAVAASCTIAVTFAPTVASGARAATLAIAAAASSSSANVSLSGTAAPPAAPLVSLVPASLVFGIYGVGMTSPALSATLTNTGNAALSVFSLAASPAEFQLSHNCPATLAAGAGCTLSVTLTPAGIGARSGSIALVSDAATSPDGVALSGTGASAAGAIFNWQSGSGSFPDTTVFGTSAPQTLTLVNQGGAAGTVQQVAISGAQAADFALDPASSCVPGAGVAVGGTCTLTLAFTPSGGGARSANLSVTSDGSGPNPASLSGNGIANGTPLLSLSPQFINLAGPPNSGLQPQALVVRNDGGGALTVSGVAASSGFRALNAGSTGGGTCPPPPFALSPGGFCTLMVSPKSGAPMTGNVTVSSNASPAPASVTVSGVALTNVGAASSGAFDGSGLLFCAALAGFLLRLRARVALRIRP